MKAILDYFGIGITEIILFVLITAGVFYLDHILKKKRQLESEREHERKQEREQREREREQEQRERERKREQKQEQEERNSEQKRERKRRSNPKEWTLEEKAKFYKKSFAKLQKIYNGRIKSELDEDEYGSIELRTTVLNRPVNIVLDDGHLGSIELRMKFINKRGTLSLVYNQKKKQSSVHEPKDEHWDDDEPLIHVFTPGVYIKENRNEIPAKIALVDALRSDLRETMFAWLIRKEASQVTISEELIKIRLEQPFYFMQSPQKIFDETFTLMNDIANHFSDDSSPIQES